MSPHPDLDWQAFAYWSDELSPEERSRFEALLADDQPAREALARVVELSHAVIAAESLAVAPARREPARPSRRVLAWVAGVGASALALVLGIAIGQFPGRSPSGEVATHRALDPDLASAWSNIRESWDELTTWQIASLEPGSLDPGSSELDSAERGASDPDARAPAGAIEHQTGSDWDAADLEAPSWMTAAVLGQLDDGEAGQDELPESDSAAGESSKES